jgi:hypothetical protein
VGKLLQSCFASITYQGDDGNWRILVTNKDGFGNPTSHEIYSYTKEANARTCFDWDRQTDRQDVKQANGAWQTVAGAN